MQIDVVTIFPGVFAPVVGSSILQRAQASRRVQITVHDLRSYTTDKRRTVDDRPFGGGPGMVMKPDPLFKAVDAIEARRHRAASRATSARKDGCQIVLMAAQGESLTQAVATQLSGLRHLVILCGHYEGVDERVRLALADREISIGDYVVTGGELPAMVLIDCVVRLLPGVLGHQDATVEESFTNGLLEYPQYTRPVSFRGMLAPEVLRSGDHRRIAKWRKLKAVARTLSRRPDLLAEHDSGATRGSARRHSNA